jgi:hypothetical protein
MDDRVRHGATMAVVGAISGMATFAFFMSSNGFWAIGAIFGLLTAPPIVRRMAYPVPRVLAMGLVCAIAYLAAMIVLQGPSELWPELQFAGIMGFGVAGAVGSGVIGLGLLGIVSRGPVLAVVGRVFMAGTAAGFGFGVLVTVLPNDNTYWPTKFCVGFVIWQSSVAAPLGRLLAELKTTIPEL